MRFQIARSPEVESYVGNKERPKRRPPTTLKTIERACDVLEAVASAKPSEQPQIRDISAAIGHNLSSTYHIVNTLITRNYLERDVQGRLSIGVKTSELNSSRVRGLDLLQFAQPIIDSLAESSDETVYLTRNVGGRVVIQLATESRKSLRATSLALGRSGNEDRRASGRAVLAYLSEEELWSAYRELYPIASVEELETRMKTLDTVRRNGFAFESDGYEAGISCLAAPFFGTDGKVGGSISVSAPTLRIDHLLNEVQSQVIAAAKQMTSMLCKNPTG
jgi:DNA-binding IclR family transcriptional regulator